MEEYLLQCKLLGVIDIPFLKSISEADAWDNLFYDLFSLQSEFDKSKEEVFIYNRNHLFFLKRNNVREIEIREAEKLCIDDSGREYLIVINYVGGANTSKLLPRITTYLDREQISFQILDRDQYSFVQDGYYTVICIDR